MADIIIGIDVGLSGGVAKLGTGVAISTPTPTLPFKQSRRVYDVPGMVHVLECHRSGAVAFIESVPTMGPTAGRLRLRSLMEGFGLWVGILSAFSVPFVLVSAQAWQKVMLKGYPTGDYRERKSSSVLAASRLYPRLNLVPDGCKKPHDGMADALLIATYGHATYEGHDRG
jgi:crossover junction endodeoxyribonuclease RuvC